MMSTRRPEARYYNTFFIVRRLLFVAIIVRLAKKPWAQAQLICLQCMVQLAYIGVARPFITRWRNALELLNESLVLLSSYFLFIYSDGFVLTSL